MKVLDLCRLYGVEIDPSMSSVGKSFALLSSLKLNFVSCPKEFLTPTISLCS
jgi:hypothetical protein